MVSFRSSITVDKQLVMSKSVNSTELSSRYRSNRKGSNSPNHLSIPDCQQSRSAAVDVVICVAVIGALGFLISPYVSPLAVSIIEIGTEGFYAVEEGVYVIGEEILQAPMVYGFLGLGILCAVIAVLAIIECTIWKCGKPGCRGLRKGAEFDIQLETEECVKNSSACLTKDGVKKGLFELPRDHHRELEAELKKMAPPNGRAVLDFKARCGCSVGRMEVLGPKRPRKVKKYSVS
ncbi:hypothetical protein RHMOL_Rhmol08G0079000 [Rhododendron molle]|uniref:Uncharacterized protein n=1 Tax=Rhododendron molle TaxID=49168 RepID=A0ACC0MKS6_RHOML|nr:hypothetical protein RHMOL_Rhmol08G0079000 [Rhododendron molle]